MRYIFRIVGLCGLSLLLCGLAVAQEVAFVGVNVLPMDDERVLSDHTVVVREGRIVAVGPSSEVSVPEGAVRVDGSDRYLIPGLAEMHGHIPSPESPSGYIEDVLFLYVANGITTVRGMQGHPGQLELREKALSGELVSPTLYLAGPGFSGGSIDSPEAAAERVRQQKAEGWDFLKILPGLTRAEYDAMAGAAKEAGIAFVGHIPSDVGLAHAIEAGQETIDHLDGYIEYLDGDEGSLDPERVRQAVRMTRDAGVWVVPTMVLWETLYGVAELEELQGYEELRYMPPGEVQAWTESFRRRRSDPNFDLEGARRVINNRERLLTALHEGGVDILMGTDAPQQFSVPGFSLHRELPTWIEAGLSPYEVLRTGTANVGRYLEQYDRFGTIAPGQRADLVLLEENPLEDVAHLRRPLGVMVRGRWLPRAELEAGLEEIATRNRP